MAHRVPSNRLTAATIVEKGAITPETAESTRAGIPLAVADQDPGADHSAPAAEVDGPCPGADRPGDPHLPDPGAARAAGPPLARGAAVDQSHPAAGTLATETLIKALHACMLNAGASRASLHQSYAFITQKTCISILPEATILL